MRKFIFFVLFILVMVPPIHAAQVTISTGEWSTLRGNINSNFTELYGKLADSAGLAASLDDESGTGLAVFSISPTLVTPILGTITSGVGTALTALDGENILADTIDDDSIDWTDVTLADFTEQTAWRVFYSNASGDVTELALGADGTYLKSNGATSAPTFATPAGSGDVNKVGTPVDSQIGVWTGDGTIEGDSALTFDTTTDTLSAGIFSGSGANLTSLDGESIQDNTIDDDSIDFSDVTLADFTEQTAWRLFYANGSGDVTELVFGTDGTYLKSNGASSAPTFETPSGSGDVSKVGTPLDSQIGVWTGDGTIEGDQSFTFDTTTDTLTAGIFSGSGASLTSLDGENIQNDTIDDDSIDWSDVTLADLVTGTGTAGNLIVDDGDGTFSTTNTLNLAMHSATDHSALTDVGHFGVDTDGDTTNITQGVFAFHDDTRVMYTVSIDEYPDTNGQVPTYNSTSKKWELAVGSGGDNIEIDSAAVVNPDFVSTGDVDFVDSSNTVTANINDNVVDSEHYVDGSIDAEHIATFYGYDNIPVAWMKDGTSAPDDLDDGSTRSPYAYRTFASDADEDLNFVWFVPADLSGSTINFRVKYLVTNATGPSATEGVAFGLSGISTGDNDATNGTKGNIVVVTDDTLDASQHDVLVTGWSGAVTITSLAAGELAECALIRDVSDAVDDYGQVVGVMAVEIRYTKDPS